MSSLKLAASGKREGPRSFRVGDALVGVETPNNVADTVNPAAFRRVRTLVEVPPPADLLVLWEVTGGLDLGTVMLGPGWATLARRAACGGP